MKRTTTQQTPSPTPEPAAQAKVDQSNPKRDFLVATMNMSWQLAIVVLVPIIGGFELDKKLDTLPALTIVGFFMAMAGMGLVVWRQLQIYAPPAPRKTNGAHS